MLVEPKGAVQTAIGDARTAQEALGECTLVEYIELDGRYCAVTLSAGRFELQAQPGVLSPQGLHLEVEGIL